MGSNAGMVTGKISIISPVGVQHFGDLIHTFIPSLPIFTSDNSNADLGSKEDTYDPINSPILDDPLLEMCLGERGQMGTE